MLIIRPTRNLCIKSCERFLQISTVCHLQNSAHLLPLEHPLIIFFWQIWLCLLHIAPCLNSFCWFVSWNICRFYPGLLINQCSEHHCINSAHFYLFSKSCNIYRNATVAFKDTKKRLLFDFEHLPMEVSLCPCFTPIWQGFLRIRGEFSRIHGVFFWFVYSSIEPRESHLSFTASERSFRYDLW